MGILITLPTKEPTDGPKKAVRKVRELEEPIVEKPIEEEDDGLL